jgi:hypothetical protein
VARNGERRLALAITAELAAATTRMEATSWLEATTRMAPGT